MKRQTEVMYDSVAYYAGEVVNHQTTYGFENNLLDIYDVEKPRGKEHIFMMSMDRSGVSEGQYSKISKMFIPYVDGATIYLKQGDSDSFIPSHDGGANIKPQPNSTIASTPPTSVKPNLL